MSEFDLEQYVKYRIQRAEETLQDAKKMAESGSWNSCINRLYYSCFYIVTALLLKHGFKAETHSGVRHQLSLHFVKPGIISKEKGAFFTELFEYRQSGDYADLIEFDAEKVKPLIPLAEEFIFEIKEKL